MKPEHVSLCVLTEGRVLEFPVIKIAEKDIVDTNGAGDAFVGGKWWLTHVMTQSQLMTDSHAMTQKTNPCNISK